MPEITKVIAEKVQWNDVIMLRTPAPGVKFRKWDFNRFDIPSDLYERWDKSIDEYWAVQMEIRKYMSGEKMVPRQRALQSNRK